MRLSLRSNIQDVLAQVKSNRTDQVPYALALALTRTAQLVKAAEINEVKAVFDRPTPATLRAFYVQSATKKKLVARVVIEDSSTSATAQVKYLAPEIDGGERNIKRFERALQFKGLLPGGMQVVPAAGAEIDSYGNMSNGQIVKILSALGALQIKAGFNGNRNGRGRGKRRDEQYFVPLQPTTLKPGVYQRFAGSHHVIPVMLFVRGITYKRRFDFYGVGQRVAAEVFKEQFRLALNQAIATAR